MKLMSVLIITGRTEHLESAASLVNIMQLSSSFISMGFVLYVRVYE